MNTSLSQKSLCTNGFTLIEMVVVITILILLTTAAFVSYSDYSSSARDSNRVSDLSGFYGALETYKAKVGELPDPSSGVSVLSGSTTELAKQGYLGADILAKIGVDRGGEDPRSGLYYTYLVNSNKDKAQLLGFFEGAGFENKLAFGVVPQAYALSDNSTLFPATTGKKLGVFLLSATKSPIQEAFSGSVTLTSLVSSGAIISGSCLSLSGSTTSSTMTGTLTLTGGTNLASCYVNSSSTSSTSSNRYPGCDTDDITLTNGQVWAACNVGATNAYIG
jgi:prepilin-type N-terminal cleavage/methylation domain-containing protein